jgi:endonuclease/exonuclease/phosphatase family metal-dependent hydrolase
VLGREIREPTLLALSLAVVGVTGLLALCVVAMAALPALGHIGWTFTGVAACLLCLAVGIGRKLETGPVSPTGRQRWFRRLCGGARWLFVAVLAVWLGLIGWSALCPGGPAPPPKADPAFIRVVTWNVHCGQDEGPPWKQFDWPRRKWGLRQALNQARPDLLCVQEATPEQVAFLEEALPGHRRVGLGRDGECGGEHCAIYFNRERFALLACGTFWLEGPANRPRPGSGLDANRICTWARLRDRASGRTLRVYNTHLPLTEAPRRRAARRIVTHLQGGDPADAVLLTADFNASPSAPSRRLFTESGLADSAGRAAAPVGRPTFHLGYGICLSCLDGILVDRHWRVHRHRVLDVKPRNTFPSDHFGVLADLVLSEEVPVSGKGRRDAVLPAAVAHRPPGGREAEGAGVELHGLVQRCHLWPGPDRLELPSFFSLATPSAVTRTPRTTSADSRGGGAASRSDRHAASRAGRTTAGRAASSWQPGGGMGRAGYATNLGPRLANALLPIPGKRDSDWGYAWIPVTGPLLGGLLAAALASGLC